MYRITLAASFWNLLKFFSSRDELQLLNPIRQGKLIWKVTIKCVAYM